MNKTVDFTITLEQKSCLNCSGIYAVNEKWFDRRYESGGDWYCPYCGTCWHMTETENMRLERKLREAKNRLSCEIASHDQTKSSLAAQKGVNTRLKNRVKNGVCPCCNRYFKNLHAHMKNKHPGFEK